MSDKAYEIVACTDGSWYVCNRESKIVGTEPTRYHALRRVRTLQGLPTCHDLLTDEGAYIWTHYEASWEDAGDAENGPQLTGGPAYDEYAGETEYLFFENGELVHSSARDCQFEEHLEIMMGDRQDGPGLLNC